MESRWGHPSGTWYTLMKRLFTFGKEILGLGGNFETVSSRGSRGERNNLRKVKLGKDFDKWDK